jgi:hypothetical protein
VKNKLQIYKVNTFHMKETIFQNWKILFYLEETTVYIRKSILYAETKEIKKQFPIQERGF